MAFDCPALLSPPAVQIPTTQAYSRVAGLLREAGRFAPKNAFLVSKYKVSSAGSLAEVLQRLTRQQAEEFTKELSERLAQRRMI